MQHSKENVSFRDIKEIVLGRIKDSTWPSDSILPTETDLAKEFSTTRTTINRALRELADEGYLDRKRKSGTRVRAAPIRQARFKIPVVREEVTERGGAYRYNLISSEISSAPEWLVAKLDLKFGQNVRHIRCLHLSNTQPFQYENRWIVLESVPDAREETFTEFSPNEWLVQKVPFTDIEVSFLATRADQLLADLLGASLNEAIFTTERSTWLKGTPVTFARLYFAPGYRMTTRL